MRKENMRIDYTTDWFSMWKSDRDSMLNTMLKNMMADLEAGYNYFGQSITRQRQEIDNYMSKTEETIEKFKSMTDKEIARWCYLDMVKRGVIDA